jgi:hypothetical protein
VRIRAPLTAAAIFSPTIVPAAAITRAANTTARRVEAPSGPHGTIVVPGVVSGSCEQGSGSVERPISWNRPNVPK